MFSHISAKGRLSSVPSPERLLTSACTFSASWRRALRMGTGNLQFGNRDRGEPRLRARNCFVDAGAGRASNDIVTVDGSDEGDARVEVLGKSWRELLQLIEGEAVELAAFQARDAPPGR